MDRDNKEILEILGKEKSFLNKNFGLVTIGLFGSSEKGKETHVSDIDFCRVK
jgi:predicted nucleotidyltransferase